MNYEEVKKINPALIPHLKRDVLCRVEIERISCILHRGMVSTSMFNELTSKLLKLSKEWPIFDKFYKEYGFDKISSSWFEEYDNFMMKQIEKVQEKFKLNICKYCDSYFEKYDVCHNDCERRHNENIF